MSHPIERHAVLLIWKSTHPARSALKTSSSRSLEQKEEKKFDSQAYTQETLLNLLLNMEIVLHVEETSSRRRGIRIASL